MKKQELFALLEFFRRFETILTAQLFLRVIQVITPISKYLQDKKNDISKAASMIINAQKTLKIFARDFKKVSQIFYLGQGGTRESRVTFWFGGGIANQKNEKGTKNGLDGDENSEFWWPYNWDK